MKKVKTGDKFAPKAETWNGFIDASQDFKNRQIGRIGASKNLSAKNVNVKVYNDSGDVWGIFTPVILTEPLVEISDTKSALKFVNTRIFRAEEYTGQSGTVAVLQEAVKTGKIGKAVVSGITPVTGEDFPGTVIWESDDWAVVQLGKDSYLGPFKIVKTGSLLEVVNGINADDLIAGFAMVNGEVYPVDAGIVMPGDGYLCLVAEEEESSEDPVIYFDVLEEPEASTFPLGYIEISDNNSIAIIQFHHSMPQLWIVGQCEDE